MANTHAPGTPVASGQTVNTAALHTGARGWVEENAKLIVGALALLIFAGIVFAVMQFIGRKQERAAQEAYYSVAVKFEKAKGEFDQAKFEQFAPAGQEKGTAKAATGDLEKDYGTVITDLEKIAREHAGTTAGAQAAILAGDTYIQYKQPEKAVELARMTSEKLNDTHTLKHLSNMLLGNALASKGDCQEAVTVWQKLIDNSKASYLHADASVRAGLCFEQLGQTDKALDMYKKASASESGAAATARGLLRALEVKAKPATETKG